TATARGVASVKPARGATTSGGSADVDGAPIPGDGAAAKRTGADNTAVDATAASNAPTTDVDGTEALVLPFPAGGADPSVRSSTPPAAAPHRRRGTAGGRPPPLPGGAERTRGPTRRPPIGPTRAPTKPRPRAAAAHFCRSYRPVGGSGHAWRDSTHRGNRRRS